MVDVSTSVSRARTRFKRILATASAGALSRAITVVSGVISVPLMISYLGQELYGVWLTATSFITVMWLADLGVGRGLVNALADALGSEDRRRAASAVASGFSALLLLAIAISALFLAVFPAVSWERLLNTESPSAAAAAQPIVLAVFVCWLGEWVTRAALRVNDGLQAGYRNHLWSGVGKAVALVSLLFAISLNASPQALVLAFAGPPVLANIANAAASFSKAPWLLPRPANVTRKLMSRLLFSGVGFLALDASYLAIHNGSLLLVSHLLGASSVPDYAVPAKMFALTSMVASLLTVPFWPAYAESEARGDRAWTNQAWRYSMAASVAVSGLASCLLVVVGPQILEIWVGDTIVVSGTTLLGFGVWNVAFVVGNTAGILLNGTGHVRFSATSQVLQAVVFLVLAVVGTRHFGIAGLVWSLATTDLLVRTTPRMLFIRRFLKPTRESRGL